MLFRPAIPADAAGIAAVHVQAWRETYAGLMPEAMIAAQSVEGRREAWTRILSREALPAEGRFVAEDDGLIVGFVATMAQRDPDLADAYPGEFAAIYLLRQAQGRGAGRRLMRLGAAHLREAGCAGASLWVLEGNLLARGFYQRLGASIVGDRVEQRPDGDLRELAVGWADLALLSQSGVTPVPTR